MGGEAGGGACTLFGQAVSMTMERLVNEANLFVVATTENTHKKMETQAQALL